MPPKKNIVSEIAKREATGRPRYPFINTRTPPSSPQPPPPPKKKRPSMKDLPDKPSGPPPPPPSAGAAGASRSLRSFKTGGVVSKTGVYTLHKGELVIPAESSATIKKLLMKK